MSPDYKTYLTKNVFHEGNIVSYRLLSHELKIHAHLAKQMLYDFHATQNAKKPGSVHATYFVSGLRESAVGEEQPAPSRADGEGDMPMTSGPHMSSSMPQDLPPGEVRRVLTLVREEGLERVKAKYKNVTTVHVYSLESASPKDIEVLCQPGQQIAKKFADDDPSVYYKQYGVIQNPNVKRRTALGKTGRGAPPAASATAPKAAAPVTSKQPATKGGPKTESKPGLKKETSDLFKSFAKAKPKEVKEEDVPMRDVSEDEGEEEPREKPDMSSTKLKQEREDREQKLRALMDNDDQPMSNTEDDEAADGEPEPKSEPEPEPEPEPELVDESALKEVEPEKEEEEPQVTVSDGRRRGKRKVMKKVTMKDEEGYLITKEEAVWEDFSEDETPAPTQKSTSTISSSKSKSSAAKGQGNIMSFFGKK